VANFFVSEARRRPRADINSRKPMNIGRLPELLGTGLMGGRRSAWFEELKRLVRTK
jgi:hypothetical protein